MYFGCECTRLQQQNNETWHSVNPFSDMLCNFRSILVSQFPPKHRNHAQLRLVSILLKLSLISELLSFTMTYHMHEKEIAVATLCRQFSFVILEMKLKCHSNSIVSAQQQSMRGSFSWNNSSWTLSSHTLHNRKIVYLNLWTEFMLNMSDSRLSQW